ncbi:hypothetical protein HHI36_002197 [Cryptolaemus montrouzieri]|uniref:Uncharacterized protein n=1 Tax=Cryptolaemus montrouzieri TaxID=559131 RepID=A0ABD2P9T2_9CUCU
MYKKDISQCALILLVLFQFTITPSNGALSKDDVTKCITETKATLQKLQTDTKARFDQIKTRKDYDSKEHLEKKTGSLNAMIQKEKGILSTFKQSAIQDNYNVTACNDSSQIVDLISKSFGTSASLILAEYKVSADRNYTQHLFLVQQLASNYQQLEKKLNDCQNQSCFEQIYGDCVDFKTEDDISDEEEKYSNDAEKILSNYKSKIDNLYQEKSKEVTAYSKALMDCYRSNLNTNITGNDTSEGNNGLKIQPTILIFSFTVLYKILL